jgi:hypothetical protein
VKLFIAATLKPVLEIELFSKPFGFELLQHPLWCKPVSGYVLKPPIFRAKAKPKGFG